MKHFIPITIGLSIGVYFVMSKYVVTPDMVYNLYKDSIDREAKIHQVDTDLICAIIFVESHGNPFAIGSTPDIGLMQITQPALTDYNMWYKSNISLISMFDPALNIRVGVSYLAWLLDQFNNHYVKAISAYNQGIGKVKSNIYSTDYYNKVQKVYNVLKGISE